MNRLTAFGCMAFCLVAESAAAQLPPPQYPLLEMSVGIGGMSPGPGARSEAALRSIGFHEGYGNQGMTQTDLNGFWKIEIGVSERRTLGVLTTRVANRTRGQRDLPGAGSISLATQQAVVTRAVTWSYRPNGWVSLGAGPALHTRRFSIDAPVGPDVAPQSKRGLGAVAGVNVKWKRENGTFAHALWQYRYAGTLSSDTVSVPVSARAGVPLQKVQWPSTQIPFSHRMLGFGFGIEF